jgi:hypothetical protein
VVGPHGGNHWNWQEANIVPWWNLTGWNPTGAARMCGETIVQAGRLILDLEPYDNGPGPDHWVKGEAEASTFQSIFNSYRADLPFDITLDYRRIPDGFPYRWWLDQCDRILPQVYWTTFQRSWRSVLEEAARLLDPLGHEIEWVLPGNASAHDLADSLDWIKERGEHASIWLWQTLTHENWNVIRHYERPDEIS